ncbi:MAG: hypothetical protein GYB32_11955 [Algicola sp.]|nr:hypothetical protein [Algicola sp.]
MKTLKRYFHLATINLLMISMLFSCSNDDGNNGNNNSINGDNYVDYTVSGSTLNDSFSISDVDSDDNVSMIGSYYSEQLTGQDPIITLVMFDSQNNSEFAVVLPAQIGSWEVTAGNSNNFDVFIITPDSSGFLEPIMVTVNITELEINQNESISLALEHIKATFSGSFELTYDNDGQEVVEPHNLTGEFAYHL